MLRMHLYLRMFARDDRGGAVIGGVALWAAAFLFGVTVVMPMIIEGQAINAGSLTIAFFERIESVVNFLFGTIGQLAPRI